MTDRIHIQLTGALPNENKFAALATAQLMADQFKADFKEKHGIELTVEVKPVKESAPRVKKVADPNALNAAIDAELKVAEAVTAIPMSTHRGHRAVGD